MNFGNVIGNQDGNQGRGFLNSNNNWLSSTGEWYSTTPDSVNITLSNDTHINNNGYTYVVYAFRSINGFSACGRSYYGNGNANGTFIYTGFKPGFLITKQTTSSNEDWTIKDLNRLPSFNRNDRQLFTNSTNAENTSSDSGIDLYSNGFKIRSSNGKVNTNGADICLYCICTRRNSSSKQRCRNSYIIMSSILKVDTIQDQSGNLIISKDSGGGGFLSPYASSSAPIVYTVTVATKTTAHPYSGVGSSNAYFINGIESPIIELKGNDTTKPYYYKFDQSDASNGSGGGHPLRFYNDVGKTTQFTTGVTTSGTPGQAGAHTTIAVDKDTPSILYYQCSSHANMGNHTILNSPTVNTGVFLKLPTTDGSKRIK